MMFLTGFSPTTTQKKRISTKRKPNWKKLSTPFSKNSTNNTVELQEEMVVMMTGMMKIFQITMSCKNLKKRERRVLHTKKTKKSLPHPENVILPGNTFHLGFLAFYHPFP